MIVPSFAAPLTAAVPVYFAAARATGAVLLHLRRRSVLDRPNERSSHVVPTPRGGGIAIMAVLLPFWAAIACFGAAPPGILAVAAAAAGLAAVSFFDDLKGLPAGLRFLVQLAAVAAGLAVLPGAGSVFQGLLPPWMDLMATGLLWVWFVNLFNFMDGIDGIAGTEAAFLGGGVALLGLLGGTGSDVWLGAGIAAAALGFLRWNWHPAKLFMGDVGSIPLGYLLGFLLLALAARGEWAAALLLPLYYLADATWTLLRRLCRGEKVWQAHREHFYQRAVQAGRSHDAVVRRIAAANAALLLMAVAARWNAWLALLPGVAAVLLLLRDLRRPPSCPAPG